MRTKKLLAAFLLGVGLCFVPALGYGEIKEWVFERKVWNINFELLRARVDYMMRNPDVFLEVDIRYSIFDRPRGLPKDVSARGKITVTISDSRNRFSHKSGVALLDEFNSHLKILYSFIADIATDMNTDVVAVLYSRQLIPLAYFYQGEYHLWGK